MIKSDVLSREITRNIRWKIFFSFSHFLKVALVVALLLGGVVIAQLLGGVIGKIGLFLICIFVGSIIMLVVISLRQDELAAMIVIAVHLYIDWYLAQYVVAQIMTIILLVCFFFTRSPQYPWISPRALWLWILFLALTISPAIHGATNLYDAAFYYPNVIFGAFIIFWLGTIIARDSVSVCRLFKMLAAFGTVIAVHTIIQAITGITLFSTSSNATFLANVSNYQLVGFNTPRLGSFFVDPNFNGAFFAMILFIPLGLFFESSFFFEKAFYLIELSLIVPALLFTYSNGAWIGTLAGFIAFVIFVGRARYRVLFPLFILIIVMMLIVFFPSQVVLQLQHAADPSELSIRSAVWQTAIQVINAFPLTGIGLGHYAYLERAAPYSVSAQYVPQDHPHNSYLEFGAMAGLPVLFVFVILLAFSLWLAFRNWVHADIRTRSVIGAGMSAVIALSVNSLSINGWTLPPLAAVGWLIFGVITSPLLAKNCNNKMKKLKSKIFTSN